MVINVDGYSPKYNLWLLPSLDIFLRNHQITIHKSVFSNHPGTGPITI